MDGSEWPVFLIVGFASGAFFGVAMSLTWIIWKMQALLDRWPKDRKGG